MKVILSEDVRSVGKVGEVVKVKDGFARNFLIPQGKAFLATPVNIKRMEVQKKKILETKMQAKKEAEAVAEKLNKVSCTVAAEVNDLDRLYGAISESEIIRALETEGFQVDRKDIIIDKPIEELGIYEVGIQLHPEVIAKIRLWVTKK